MNTINHEGHGVHEADSLHEELAAMRLAELEMLHSDAQAILARRAAKRARQARIHDGLCACSAACLVLGTGLLVAATKMPTEDSWAFYLAGLATLAGCVLCLVCAALNNPDREVL